jgi:large subunit ribosomal protein L17
MRHRVNFVRLSRKAAHRKALYRSMITSLFRHERIRTTITKAKEVRRLAEKLITKALVDSVHKRRLAARKISNKAILGKLFTDIAPRYSDRKPGGGYTRIIKLGPRISDGSEMVFLELLDRKIFEKKKKKKKEQTAIKPV